MQSKYILRLDDASEHMDIANWRRMEMLLDRYSIKPLVGIIPKNEDPDFMIYPNYLGFWSKAQEWINKGWTMALHGYNHVLHPCVTSNNPINDYSEFAGLPYELQAEKIIKGLDIFKSKNIKCDVFFAPAHTYDNNTLLALKNHSKIRVISDTIANNVYYKDDFYFVPQQSGVVRKLPFKVVTFCYHPNSMSEKMYEDLEHFLSKYNSNFIDFKSIKLVKRSPSLVDKLLSKIYFFKKRI